MTYQEKLKKHQEITKTYLKAVHTSLGKLWEIPECCINQFVEEQLIGGIFSVEYRQGKHQKMIPKELEYVPCDECMKKLYEKL